MNQLIVNLIFVAVAVVGVILLLAVWRYWSAYLNMSDEEIELERRMAALNERQAFRRRDDEIVRLLRGDEQVTVDQQDVSRD
ncbi:hypothetical protein [Kallotenue papyrolyticum]|uniref:hypothetical protein n=1 Tax=Kallotenue papyrolyticum TaxID=1325125 RepID=UPI00047862CB|nr:hypothetical protein [Kallotenue papyrolyticum]